jgi:hypothetical protein
MDKTDKRGPHPRAVLHVNGVEGLHSRGILRLNGALGFHPRGVLLREWAENKKPTAQVAADLDFFGFSV